MSKRRKKPTMSLAEVNRFVKATLANGAELEATNSAETGFIIIRIARQLPEMSPSHSSSREFEEPEVVEKLETWQ